MERSGYWCARVWIIGVVGGLDEWAGCCLVEHQTMATLGAGEGGTLRVGGVGIGEVVRGSGRLLAKMVAS